MFLVIGVLVLVLLLAVFLFMWMLRRRRRSAGGPAVPDKVDGTIGRRELVADEDDVTSKLPKTTAELQEVRRVELEGNLPKEKPAYELPG